MGFPGYGSSPFASRATGLREAFASGSLVRTAGAHDGLSARLAEEAGIAGICIEDKVFPKRNSFMREWKHRAPVVVVPTTYSNFSTAEAAEAGIAMVIYANQGMRAAVTAMRDTWATVLAAGSTAEVEPKIATVKDIFALSGMDQWLEIER